MAKQDWKLLKHGGVRDSFINDDHKIMFVTTDKVSAFGRILKSEVPGQGKLLTKISTNWHRLINTQFQGSMSANVYSAYYLHRYSNGDGVGPTSYNIYSAYYPKDCRLGSYYDDFNDEYFADRLVLMDRLEMLPVQVLIKGYCVDCDIEYDLKTSQTLGATPPQDIAQFSKLPKPIFIPIVKTVANQDLAITVEESENVLNESFPEYGQQLLDEIRYQSLLLYEWGAQYTLEHGLVIAATKFKFGINRQHFDLALGESVFTPDSSRIWLAEDHIFGDPPVSLDNHYLLNFLKTHPAYLNNDRPLPPAIIQRLTRNYQKIHDLLFA